MSERVLIFSGGHDQRGTRRSGGGSSVYDIGSPFGTLVHSLHWLLFAKGPLMLAVKDAQTKPSEHEECHQHEDAFNRSEALSHDRLQGALHSIDQR